MRALKFAAALALIFVSLVASAEAQPPKLYDRLTPRQINSIMEKQGYTVLLQEDNTFVAWITEDIDIMLVSADKTNSLNFYTYVKNSPITLSQVNEWNRREKYSKLYLDGDGDVSLELDLDMTDGVTEERIISFLETCAETYPRFFKLAK